MERENLLNETNQYNNELKYTKEAKEDLEDLEDLEEELEIERLQQTQLNELQEELEIERLQQTQLNELQEQLQETGLNETELYQNIAQLIRNQRIEKIIGIGAQIDRNKHNFDHIETYPTAMSLIESGDLNMIQDSVILLKGARKYSFEKIVNALENKTHCTQLEINLEALQHNLSYYRKIIGSKNKIRMRQTRPSPTEGWH